MFGTVRAVNSEYANLPVVSTKNFTFKKNERKFTAFASDLYPQFQAGFPQQFQLESQKTRDRVLVNNPIPERNRDGELEAVKYFTRINGQIYTVLIFND